GRVRFPESRPSDFRRNGRRRSRVRAAQLRSRRRRDSASMRRSARSGRPSERAPERPVPAQQGRAPAPGGGERARAQAADADSGRTDHRPGPSRAASDDGAGAGPQPRRNRDRDHYAYAVAGRAVCAARRAAAQRRQDFRRRRARVFHAGRTAAVVVIPGAGDHRVEPPLRDAGADHRRIRRVDQGARLMPIYLYIDRGTFVHRLHPTVKVFALFVMFWSVYWVDNPIALAPVGVVMLWIAQLTDSWPNFYRLRWLFAILVFT